MICLRTFSTEDEVLLALESAGLARRSVSGAMRHDQSCVDVFEVWPRVYGPVVTREGPVDMWQNDTSKPSKWTANIYRGLTAAETQALAVDMADAPAFPLRVCA